MNLANLKICFKSRFILRNDLSQVKSALKLFQDTLTYARQRHESQSQDQFLQSFLLISHKVLLDSSSILILWERGLYGSALALCEVGLRSRRMLAALYLEPSLIEEYLAEEKTSDQDSAFRRKFAESSLQKVLDQRFGSVERGPYANFEKAVHGSSVGIKVFYGKIRHNPDGSRGGDITFTPFFEKEKSAAMLGILEGLLLDMCGIFLEHYNDDLVPKKLFAEYKKHVSKTLRRWKEEDLSSAQPID